MKNKTHIWLLLITLFSACGKEIPSSNDEKVEITMHLAAPAASPFSAETRSPYSTPSGYKPRYILEVYYLDTIYLRKEDYNSEISFSLLSGHSYDFLVWADYVPSTDSVKKDHHYNTQSGLKAVSLAVNPNEYTGSNESRDAFCGKILAREVNSNFQLTLTLQRPFARFEIINKSALAAEKDVKIVYKTPLNNRYNVATGEASAEGEISPNYPRTQSKQTLIAFDYLFVSLEKPEYKTMDITVGGTTKTGNLIPFKANTCTKIQSTF